MGVHVCVCLSEIVSLRMNDILYLKSGSVKSQFVTFISLDITNA